MTTPNTAARERARRAARQVFEDKRDHVYEHNESNPGLQIELRVGAGEYADAASDVWEPLLRDLLVAIRGLRFYEDGEHFPDDWQAAIDRAREALGPGGSE